MTHPPTQPPYNPPPAPAPGYKLAGFVDRFAAVLLDSFIIAIPLLILSGISAAIFGSESVIFNLLYLVFVVAAFGYYFYFMSRPGSRNGQTLGKQVLKVRVIRDGGEPVTASTVVMREILGKFVSGFLCYIGYIWALFDDTNRAWHDMIAKTHVVSTDSEGNVL